MKQKEKQTSTNSLAREKSGRQYGMSQNKMAASVVFPRLKRS